MALSRKAWIAGGMGARLLMIAVLAVSVPLTVHNHTKRDYDTDFYKLQSYSYTVGDGDGRRRRAADPRRRLPPLQEQPDDAQRPHPRHHSLCADVVVTALLASGVGAGFGATDDALRYVHHVRWDDTRTKDDLIDYYNKAIVPVVFLLVGMVLSMAATVVSARLRARATADVDADV
ncbi:hypothetical protein SORBI_3004G185400 [Sorghum bicolor]|uniref:CASP-like protein n=1 Tax=Sorghum bicolor TaxID=4558 RepID=A0A1Z5RN44_SORBI|nr:hypothetical protein SORBI_3004G185400 [Sorghum bicolor]